ncbi:GNAT family N-acetyltransferase [Evansella clarkii]|uniref:GNAT family N-acetyltransferase n=1 Tax=Evansella clarkii TaxID=79879 RepID=UPI0009968C16|nr:GNAT family N-acetyltransferase [Evansella clarkii]
MAVQLRQVTIDNWEECISLKVGSGQKGFVASNMYSLVQSRYETSYVPLAVYSDTQMVGFVMYGKDPEDGIYWMVRLMIDEKHQGKGFGREAVLKTLGLIKGLPDCSPYIITSFVPENLTAGQLYQSVGFQETGEIIDGEKEARYYIQSPVH